MIHARNWLSIVYLNESKNSNRNVKSIFATTVCSYGVRLTFAECARTQHCNVQHSTLESTNIGRRHILCFLI